ncbi:hypothetical protein A0H76_664 [Hepatospora eriocheir]|uniref:Uncharacterized protein n=1 Tax=Hepatospora eriocheir TaxID=1081669 RepID=A0A1X0QL25_9MICR|nr:hypothetical protein A0H76_664 [Hepatospora eriocheir]
MFLILIFVLLISNVSLNSNSLSSLSLLSILFNSFTSSLSLLESSLYNFFDSLTGHLVNLIKHNKLLSLIFINKFF